MIFIYHTPSTNHDYHMYHFRVFNDLTVMINLLLKKSILHFLTQMQNYP